MDKDRCKICGNRSLSIFAHTAKCKECDILLYYPYPQTDQSSIDTNRGKNWPKEKVLDWYSKSSFYNHKNFTNMVKFAIDESEKRKQINILDYGGGGGQFALVCRSLFPGSKVYITDISDDSLLEEWKPLNIQIPFKDFKMDSITFDYIFMNDVFEHLSDPIHVLVQLSNKLKKGGRLFIDTPKQFWLYPVTKAFSKNLYTKVLRGTVSEAHLQIWSKKSFDIVIKKSHLEIIKYKETSEYTMPASFYLKNMNVTNPIIMTLGRLFYYNAAWFAKNKIVCLLARKNK
jgi:2-polyprenyl-3-methyl-5-hydroxy-6-metoxy-1,4-benzoquinol methylase